MNDTIRTAVHKLTAISAERRNVPMVAVLLAEDDLGPLIELAARMAHTFDVGGLTEQRDLMRRLLVAVEAAK